VFMNFSSTYHKDLPQAEDLMPGQLGAPTVNIINPPDVPDPQGMSGVLAAIQNGDMVYSIGCHDLHRFKYQEG